MVTYSPWQVLTKGCKCCWLLFGQLRLELLTGRGRPSAFLPLTGDCSPSTRNYQGCKLNRDAEDEQLSVWETFLLVRETEVQQRWAGRLGGGPALGGVCWGQGTRWGLGVGRMIQQQPHFCSRPFGSPLLCKQKLGCVGQ